MNIPERITILDGAFAMDGGSISLRISDPDDHEHSVLLSQHLLPPSGHTGEHKPGRLYFDGRIIEIRSVEEASIISVLRQADVEIMAAPISRVNAIDTDQHVMIIGEDIKAYYSKIAEGPESALKHLVTELIEYVESKEYVAFAVRNGE